MKHAREQILDDVEARLKSIVARDDGQENVFRDPSKAIESQILPAVVITPDEEAVLPGGQTLVNPSGAFYNRSFIVNVGIIALTNTERDDICAAIETNIFIDSEVGDSRAFVSVDFADDASGSQRLWTAAMRFAYDYRTTLENPFNILRVAS